MTNLQTKFATLKSGRAENLLRDIESESLDAVITDPPYSSGGLHRGDRSQDPSAKYEHSGTHDKRRTFEGDNRDGRSFGFWQSMWMIQAHEALKPSGYIMVFTDWRQLPTTTDALQAAGFVWRGIVPWDKTSATRAPHKGYFRHQAEYVVWGTRGPCRKAEHDGPVDGVYRERVDPRQKFHMAGKPVELMKHLCRLVDPGGIICDPFMGSGSTGVAAVQTGRRFIGFDVIPENVELSARRIREVE